jgi:L-fuconolactonase
VIVDAHHHFWDGHGPDDLPRVAEASVLVQAEDMAAENERLAAWAPHVAGVVAWTGPRPHIAGLVGVRCLAERERLRFEPGLALDVVPVSEAHVRAVCALADAHPDLRIVVDHLARPPLAGGDWAGWEAGVRALAARPNVAMKVSVGIAVLDDWVWDAAALERPVAHAVACFGPERLMLASNWPVILRRATYVTAWSDLAAVCGHDPRILGGTASAWYQFTG